MSDLFDRAYLDQLQARGMRPAAELKRLGRITDAQFFADNFVLHDQAGACDDIPPERAHVVTGFGPTNAPTAGTLSVIFRMLTLVRETGFGGATVIVSDLGAWASRRRSPHEIATVTRQFVDFLTAVGLEGDGVTVRTHQDLDNLAMAGVLTRYLSEQDFDANAEETQALYGELNLLGNRFGVMVDASYTVADILGPIVHGGADRVLVLAGIEEHYFVDLARVALTRLAAPEETWVAPGRTPWVCGIYANLVAGYPPYPKMSKSIPESAIGLRESEADLRAKILDGPPASDPILLQLMTGVSDWSMEDRARARTAFDQRGEDPTTWFALRERYLELFLGVRRLWHKAGTGSGTSIFVRRPAAP